MGFIGIMGVIFIAVGLLISMPSSKNHAGNGSPAHEKIHYTAQFTDTPASDSSQQAINSNNEDTFTDVTGTVPDAEEIAHKAELFANKRELHRLLWFYPTLIMKPVSDKMVKRCWRMRHLH